MQIQADVLGASIERLAIPEASALGAAICAGEGALLWDAQRIAANRRVDRTFEPQVSNDNREARFMHWQRACGIDKR